MAMADHPKQTHETTTASGNEEPRLIAPTQLDRIKIWLGAHRKALIIAGAALAVAALSLGGYLLLRNNIVRRSALDAAAVEQSRPATKISPLTGLEVAADLADRPVTAIMIENSPQARPQSALIDAGVVFEAVTEGGITRFLALYQEARPSRIGPVRSIRVPFVDWYMGFDAVLAHVGGAAEALALIRQRGARDLDQFAGGQYFYRSNDRFAPHNMYTSTSRLDAYSRAKGYRTSAFEPYARQAESPAAQPTTPTITINYSGSLFSVQYKYRAGSNDYTRFMTGAPHTDHENGRQIIAKNVVLIRMPTTYSGRYAVMRTIGSGKATVFRDGTKVEGTWKKTSPAGQLQLLDATGQDIPLNPGNTWFAVLPTQGSASY